MEGRAVWLRVVRAIHCKAPRDTEIQEIFFYLFILIYLWSLHYRIAQRRSAARSRLRDQG